MAKRQTKRWGIQQDGILSKLVSTGDMDPNNNNPKYCFTITQTFSPDFVGEGRTGYATAVQHLQRKFNRIQLDRELHGGRSEYV
jgi:hypothetical protein